ncbi:acid protease [Dendrothele bispora CBS 962.96]|uniref:Acid protease n=1 Tax=Dendrothele bispora (strain CBS 962.96) TaxID=1314807 RepID=A0A4S8M4K5_DENBC|nr:acid protease [Dendrothele bispora CBS 962.96]
MAGFAVTNQVFAVCDQVSDNLLSSPVSGLMGLAFETISSSGATPWWQNLAQSNAWDEPLMAFQLTRFGADPSAQSEEIGGSFNLGFTNQTLYKGDIDFQAIPDGQETYWIQSLTKLSVNGTQVQLPATSGPSTYVAIDTGTTSIGGPEDVIQGIYAQVPGSRALPGNSEGYYTFPCDQNVQVSMGYGSSSNVWAISSDDFKAFQISQTMCVGAFFPLDLGGGSESGGNGGTGGVPNWIVVDSFLEMHGGEEKASRQVPFPCLCPHLFPDESSFGQSAFVFSSFGRKPGWWCFSHRVVGPIASGVVEVLAHETHTRNGELVLIDGFCRRSFGLFLQGGVFKL